MCSGKVSESDSEILNYMYQTAYEATATTSMTNEEWEAAHKKAEGYMDIAKDKESTEWFRLIDQYYDKETLIRVDKIKGELEAT